MNDTSSPTSMPASMPAWTPETLSEYISESQTSSATHGLSTNLPQHKFMVKPLMKGFSDPSDDVTRMTEAHANAIYVDDTPFSILSFDAYQTIVERCFAHYKIGPYMRSNDVKVIVKGSNAHALLFPKECEYSDLDINIIINPNIEETEFNTLRSLIIVIVSQALSAHKKTLDYMLFLDNPRNVPQKKLMSDDNIKSFKQKHIEQMNLMGAQSPFENNKVRDACSRHSFMILNSKSQEDKVVIMDVPFLPSCNKIVLRRTPITLSLNDTINCVSEKGITSSFTLIRLKWNNLIHIPRDDVVEVRLEVSSSGSGSSSPSDEQDEFVTLDMSPKLKPSYVSADFIDVCIPRREDDVLRDMWENEKTILVKEKNTNYNILIPSLDSMIHDLNNILIKYECPPSKKTKRQEKMEFFKGKKGKKEKKEKKDEEEKWEKQKQDREMLFNRFAAVKQANQMREAQEEKTQASQAFQEEKPKTFQAFKAFQASQPSQAFQTPQVPLMHNVQTSQMSQMSQMSQPQMPYVPSFPFASGMHGMHGMNSVHSMYGMYAPPQTVYVRGINATLSNANY